MSFSIFLTLWLVFSCHWPVAFGSRSSSDQPGVGLAGRSFNSTLATTFNKSNDEVGAAKDRRVFSLWTADQNQNNFISDSDLLSNQLFSHLYETARLSAGFSACHVTRTLGLINVCERVTRTPANKNYVLCLFGSF